MLVVRLLGLTLVIMQPLAVVAHEQQVMFHQLLLGQVALVAQDYRRI